MGAAGIALGVSLLVGFLTPVAGGLAALACAVISFSPIPLPLPDLCGTRLFAADAIAMALAVALLGPGAFSLDARVFGRREIIIPARPQSPRS